MENKDYLSSEDFINIYSKVPRLCVDVIIKSQEGILLALRDIVPWKGLWHLPGGTVFKGEKLADAALRIAKAETGLDVKLGKQLGVIEFLVEVRPEATTHSVSIVFEAESIGGEMKPDKNSKELRYFKELPLDAIPGHLEFLSKNIIL